MLQSNLSSLAYDQILQSIVSFELAPGTALQERSLANRLEMSRTPVREALHRLTYEGWIHNSFRRKVMEVRPVSDKDVEELLNLRMLLELKFFHILVGNGRTSVPATCAGSEEGQFSGGWRADGRSSAWNPYVSASC